ncbi:MAG: hypothetical protein U0Q07_17550 [Acidimicrobiales bacterium]
MTAPATPRPAHRVARAAGLAAALLLPVASACGREAPPPPAPASSAVPATTAAPGTTRPVGRTTTTVGGTTLPRPGSTPGTEPSGGTVVGDQARRASALCVEAREIAEGPVTREQVAAAAQHLPATFAALPASDPALQQAAADRFATGTAELLGAADAGQGRGAGRGPVPAAMVWPEGVAAGLGACFVGQSGGRAPTSVRLPAPSARPADDAALDALVRTELAVVDPFGLVDTGSACVTDQLAARRADLRELLQQTSAAAWAEGFGTAAADVAGACGATVRTVRADGTGGTLVFLAPAGSFAAGQGPNV